MFGAYCATGVLGLLTLSGIRWVVAGTVDVHRKVRAAARIAARFQRADYRQRKGTRPAG